MTFIDITAFKSIAVVTRRTSAFERTNEIIALGITITRTSETLIQIGTEKVITGEASFTFTVVTANRIVTNGIISTSVNF